MALFKTAKTVSGITKKFTADLEAVSKEQVAIAEEAERKIIEQEKIAKEARSEENAAQLAISNIRKMFGFTSEVVGEPELNLDEAYVTVTVPETKEEPIGMQEASAATAQGKSVDQTGQGEVRD